MSTSSLRTSETGGEQKDRSAGAGKGTRAAARAGVAQREWPRSRSRGGSGSRSRSRSSSAEGCQHLKSCSSRSDSCLYIFIDILPPSRCSLMSSMDDCRNRLKTGSKDAVGLIRPAPSATCDLMFRSMAARAKFLTLTTMADQAGGAAAD
eukprot:669554-Hanusia_phi.AAC.2